MPIEIVSYQATWPAEFRDYAQKLKEALGNDALAIHHIGSTSVPELAAKDIIDMQITVKDLNAVIQEKLEPLGLVFRPDIDHDHCPKGLTLAAEDLEKRYFQNKDRLMNIHLRVQGRFNQRYALLCRDYLRTHAMVAYAYAEIKRQLARYFPNNVDAYYDIKDPVFDIIMSGALDWAEMTAWHVPPSDV